MNAANRWLSLVFWCFIILVALLCNSVFAQEHRHPPQDAAIHEKFYKNWMMPDNRSLSCCHDEDCAPAEAKRINGQWYARKIGEDGEFTPIPPEKVEQERDSPDGRNHLCGRPTRFGTSVYCFIPSASY